MGLIEVAGALRPRTGERICGDAWIQRDDGPITLLAIVDGLGHGVGAAQAAGIATTYLLEDALVGAAPFQLDRLLLELHRRLSSSRGAVAGIAIIDSATAVVHYGGIGNTEVRLLNGEPSHLYSRPGMLGGGRRVHPVAQQAPFPSGAVLILHTDGIKPIELGRISRTLSCAQIAQSLLEQRVRDDDAAIVVARRTEQR